MGGHPYKKSHLRVQLCGGVWLGRGDGDCCDDHFHLPYSGCWVLLNQLLGSRRVHTVVFGAHDAFVWTHALPTVVHAFCTRRQAAAIAYWNRPNVCCLDIGLRGRKVAIRPVELPQQRLMPALGCHTVFPSNRSALAGLSFNTGAHSCVSLTTEHAPAIPSCAAVTGCPRCMGTAMWAIR